MSAFETDNGYWFRPVDSNRLSFTYMQPSIATQPFGPAGFILWPQDFINDLRANSSPNVFSPRFHCGFPIDGMTDVRPDSGCGATPNVPESASCQSLGINDAQTWMARYPNPNSSYICGFMLNGDATANTNAANAITSIITGSNIRTTAEYPWNEIAIESWPSDNPDRVPVMAFFYMTEFDYVAAKKAKRSGRMGPDIRDSAGALAYAQQQQSLYYSTTNIFVPIIKISGQFPTVTFSFSLSDQAQGIPENVNIYPN